MGRHWLVEALTRPSRYGICRQGSCSIRSLDIQIWFYQWPSVRMGRLWLVEVVTRPLRYGICRRGSCSTRSSGHTYIVSSVAISADGQTLVSGSYDKTIKIWNMQTRQLLHTLSGYTDLVRSVAISADEQTLVSGSDDKTIKIWKEE